MLILSPVSVRNGPSKADVRGAEVSTGALDESAQAEGDAVAGALSSVESAAAAASGALGELSHAESDAVAGTLCSVVLRGSAAVVKKIN